MVTPYAAFAMSAEGKTISGDGLISDDSSFYGDEEEQAQLLRLVDDFDPTSYWETRHTDLNVARAMENSAPHVALKNPYAGRPSAWQLHEPIAQFLERLPPATTTVGAVGPWIWIGNPHPSGQDDSSQNFTDLRTRGAELLQQSKERRQKIREQNFGQAKTTVDKLLLQETRKLQEQINALAGETHVLTGKWMLFPAPEDLHQVWKAVAEAVIENQLGMAAKVATDAGRPGSRLICVYTKDFRDTEDVHRVLKKLVDLGLVHKGGPGIYYKADAYTHMDIYGTNANAYGLQPSLYSSRSMLSKHPGPAGTPEKPQKSQGISNVFFRR